MSNNISKAVRLIILQKKKKFKMITLTSKLHKYDNQMHISQEQDLWNIYVTCYSVFSTNQL